MFDQALLAALNHLLAGANWARARLVPFAGRRARFDLPLFALAFEIAPDGLVGPDAGAGAADVVIRLPADMLFLLPQGIDRVMAQANFVGNAEFATELSFVFRNLRWDAEEDLARLVGDIAAHRIVTGATHFVAWQQQAATHCAQNLGEYLSIETPVLAPRKELLALRDDIARLDADLTSVESRLAALTC